MAGIPARAPSSSGPAAEPASDSTVGRTSSPSLRAVTTALTEVQAERDLQAAMEGEAAAKEYLDGDHLLAHMMRLAQGRKFIGKPRAFSLYAFEFRLLFCR